MKRVIILTHGFYHDRRTGATFHENVLFNPDPDAKKGSKVRLGVAEDVPPEAVREYYLGHKHYLVEGYTDEELYPDGVPDKVLEAREAAEEAGATKATEAVGASESPPAKEEASEDASGEPEQGESKEPSLEGIAFASPNAEETAHTFGMDASNFDGITPSGKDGKYSVGDVRAANKKRSA